jgi:hypothetical protein
MFGILNWKTSYKRVYTAKLTLKLIHFLFLQFSLLSAFVRRNMMAWVINVVFVFIVVIVNPLVSELSVILFRLSVSSG